MAEAMLESMESYPKNTRSDDEDSDGDGWNETELGGEQTTCLFCPLHFHTIAVALDHCRRVHDFDLLFLKNKYNMDCYSYIKMINYIRRHRPEAKLLVEPTIALWEDDCYLKPGEIEPWLMYDFDDLGSAPSTPHYAIDGKTPIGNLNFGDLQKHIQDLNLQLKQKDMLIESYRIDMEKMKKVTRTLVDVDESNITETPSSSVGTGEYYFMAYSHFGIHQEMLKDKVRTESYENAILKNCDIFKDKDVLDIGCGTGILSLFGAKAGAKTVIGIDQSEIVYKAMDVVRDNSLYDTVQLIKGQLERTNLPIEKFDIIISEWMGYFLLFEGMLDSIIYARNRYLKDGGIILPNKYNMSLVGICDKERYNGLINFWDNVYGFTMNCMKSDILREAYIDTVACENILTDPVIIAEIDLMTCTTQVYNFKRDFTLKALKDGTLTSIAGYFDTFFDLPHKVQFSTGPQSKKTHWQQTIFYLKDTIELKEGQSIKGVIECERLKNNPRGLTISLIINSFKYSYFLD